MVDKSAKPEGHENEPLLLNANAVAALCSVSVRQWWRWDSASRTPRAIQIGQTKRWSREELKEWIRAGCPPRVEWDETRRSR